ncbi:PREDICTED: nucleolar protein 10-like, partial [Rhagoletis zephyria]|uniref:nucleolar protein 10-like n=1 Tax=Rhagoletis zephyria TaxID=28612 RepID=UPI00081198C5
MPTVSNTVNISPDGQYIVATGIYKPRVRCYDVNQLALKFERGLDAQVVKCIILSEDYSKLLFLEEERYVELHSQFGFYYKTRIPRFGRDMAYNAVTCDALFVGAGPEIFRLNLEVGTYLKPFETGAVAGLNAVALNPVHNLLVTGSQEGLVEAWDTRARERVATLDCAYDVVRTEVNLASKRIPAVSTIAFRDDGLTMGVGTSGGQILLYDIRANRPHLTKDHMFGLPIKSIAYLDGPLNLVASLDSKIVKFWNRHTGAPYTAIQADRDLNGLAAYPNSGMFFLANESEKLLSYYIPSIGPAPRWCSFLDRITEELEESTENDALYDDYKFVTEAELAEIGLSDLIGTNLLRAYMHGYFMDMRLYRKARDASQPFAYEEYRKAKIRERLEAERVDRVSVQDRLPKVNRALAERLLLDEEANATSKKSKSKKFVPNPLKDERFATIFTNPDFQVDELSEEFRLLNPVLSRMSRPEKADDGAKPLYADVFGKGEGEGEISSDSSEDSDDDLFSGGGGRAGAAAAAEDSEEEFSDDDDEEEDENEDADLEDTRTDRKQQQQQKQQQRQQPAKQQQQQQPQPTKKPTESPPTSQITTKVYRMKSDTAYNGLPATAQQDSKGKQRRVVNTAKQTFEQRLRSSEQQQQQSSGGSGESARLLHGGIGGNRVMTFTPSSSGREREAE